MQIEAGKILKGKVTEITNFGAFVELEGGGSGLVHISEISNDYVKDINDHIKIGDEVEVKVLPSTNGKISLSIKQASPDAPKAKPIHKKRERKQPENTGLVGAPAEFTWGSNKQESMSFDDMLNKFKQSSDEKMHDIKRNMESKRGTSRRGGSY